MTRDDVTLAALALRDRFGEEGFGPVAINMGLCADFADALSVDLAEAGVDAEVFTLDCYWSPDGGLDADAAARRAAVRLPEGLDWDVLTMAEVANRASHAWVEFGGMCFDAEMTDGVASPFDLPSIRHALTEIFDLDPTLFPDDLEGRDWWIASRDLRAVREAEMGVPAARLAF